MTDKISRNEDTNIVLAAPHELVDFKYKNSIIKVFCSMCGKDNLYISKSLFNIIKIDKKARIMCVECCEKEECDDCSFIDMKHHYNIDKTSGEEIKKIPKASKTKEVERIFNKILIYVKNKKDSS